MSSIPGYNLAQGRRQLTHTGPGQQALRLADRRKPEIVRVRLHPFDTALVAVDAEPQAVFITRRNLAAPKHVLAGIAPPLMSYLLITENMTVAPKRCPEAKICRRRPRCRQIFEKQIGPSGTSEMNTFASLNRALYRRNDPQGL